MAASVLWAILCVCLLIKTISEAQACIQGRSGGGLPSFQDYDDDDDFDKITRHHQAIIPSYKFDCSDLMCGNITEWGVDVQPDGGMHQLLYTLDLQVWRPSPTVDDSTGTGCYSLVGNNRFTSISLSGRVAVVTPSPQDYIQFRSGDVLGFYVEEARDSDFDGVVILTMYTGMKKISELVWYASIAPTMATSQNGDCPYSVGNDGGILNTSTRAAPVISVSTVTFPCPLLPSMATIQPTPPDPTTQSDSEKTPPTTSQQTQEPLGTSEGAAGTELREPITSETATDISILRSSEHTDIGLMMGIVVIVIVVIASVVTVVVVSAIQVKKRSGKMTTVAVPTTANQAYGQTAYGLTHHSEGVEDNIYNYPEVDLDTDTIEAKQNEAYVSNTDIITEGNQAYATNIITEKNVAYKPVITVETVDEYDYI